MPGPLRQNLIKEHAPETDWHAASPVLQVRWLVLASVLVPFLLAAGVYWLRHVPVGTTSTTTDAVVEVHLINSPQHIAPVRAVVVPPNPAASSLQPTPLVEDPNRSIPTDTRSASIEPSPTSTATTTSVPTSTGAPVHVRASQLAAAFQQTLLRHIARFQYYPDEARRDRIQGTVQLMFAMQRDGTVTNVWVEASSGSDILDTAAIDTVQRAQPLPRIPLDLPGKLNILFPVEFALP
jgi:periplasmic protein TonB